MTVDQNVYRQMMAQQPKREAPLHRRFYPYIILVLTGVYLFLEAAYNVGLVRMLSSSATTRDTVEGMEVIGKGLAAAGVSLAIVRILPTWRIRSFLVLAVTLFFTFGALIDQAIESLPPSMKLAGHYMGLYRMAVVKGEINDPEIGQHGDLPSTAKLIATTNIALIGLGHTGEIEKKVAGYADMRFRKEVKRAFSAQEFEQLWDGYSEASNRLLPFWERYKGKRVYNGLLFEDNERGKVEFLNRIKIPEAREYRETMIYYGNLEYGIPPLKAGDIPPFMTKAELKRWIDRFVSDGQSKVLERIAPTEANIGVNRLSNDLSSSVFVPPVSMSLSLFSMVLNALSFVAVAIALVVSFVMQRKPSFRSLSLQASAFGVAAAILVAPLAQATTPFPEKSEFQRLLDRADSGGLVLRAWSFAIKSEEIVYTTASKIPGVTALADDLPKIGLMVAGGQPLSK